MADFDTGIYSLSNQVNPVHQAQAGFNLGKDVEESGLKMQTLGMETQLAKQKFQDDQSVRQAMKDNVDANGMVNMHPAISQIAQQNPILAKQIDAQMKKYGIDGAASHAERMQQFYANTTPETYAGDKQKLLDEGIEEANQLPDALPESARIRGMMAMGTATQQTSQIAAQAQRENDLKKMWLEQNGSLSGYPEGKDLNDIYGMKKSTNQGRMNNQDSSQNMQGQVPPANQFSKRDVHALDEVNKELGNRAQSADYVTAKNNLMAIKNVKGLIYSNGDMNKVTNTMIPMVVTEAAKVMKGGVPTKEEFDAMSPENRQRTMAELISKMTGKQVPANQESYLKMIDSYMDDLQQTSQEIMRGHHKDAINNGLSSGMNPETAKRLSVSKENLIKDLSWHQKKNQSSVGQPNQQFQSAEVWLNSPAAKNISPEKLQQVKDRINLLKGQR